MERKFIDTMDKHIKGKGEFARDEQFLTFHSMFSQHLMLRTLKSLYEKSSPSFYELTRFHCT